MLFTGASGEPLHDVREGVGGVSDGGVSDGT